MSGRVLKNTGLHEANLRGAFVRCPRKRERGARNTDGEKTEEVVSPYILYDFFALFLLIKSLTSQDTAPFFSQDFSPTRKQDTKQRATTDTQGRKEVGAS